MATAAQPSANPILTIRLIRAFEGPIHDELYRIWDAVAEYMAPDINVRVFANPGGKLSHAEAFQAIWAEEREFDNDFLCLTEFDFLPNLARRDGDWLGVRLANKYPAWGCQYASRGADARNGMRFHRKLAGGWFLVLNKARVPPFLYFDGNPDPCNELPFQLDNHDCLMYLERGKDAWPRHPGISYSYGDHLFWSRHYNDDPETVVSGMKMGTVQMLVREEIARWLKKQPARFRQIYRERFLSTAESQPAGDPAPSAP